MTIWACLGWILGMGMGTWVFYHGIRMQSLSISEGLAWRELRQRHRKLREAREVLVRLEAKEELGRRLTKSQFSLSALNRYEDQFHSTLLAIEQHLMLGESDHAEEVIVVFARHLRHVLQEGSLPFIPLHESIEYIRTHVQLMGLLTNNRFHCLLEVHPECIESGDRMTESLILTPWIEQWIWPLFELGERQKNILPTIRITLEKHGDEITVCCHRPFELGEKPWAKLTIPLLGSGHLTQPHAA